MSHIRRITFAVLLAAGFVFTGWPGSGSPGVAQAERIDGCGQAGPRIEQGQTGILLGETSLRVAVPETGTVSRCPDCRDNPAPSSSSAT